MNLKDKMQSVVSSRTRWALLVVVLLVGVSVGFVLAPARATHLPGHLPTEFMERVDLGDSEKYGALFIYCDNGFRVWVATAPNGNPSVYAQSALGGACQTPPPVLRP